MKTIHHSDIHGKTLTKVYLCDEGWRPLRTYTQVPDLTKLLNFEVKAKDQKEMKSFLVLDNYGDEISPEVVFRRIFTMGIFEFNLAIDLTSGAFYTAQFVKEKSQYAMTLAKLKGGEGSEPIFLPKKFLRRVDELKSKKRPYFFTCWETAMWAFVNQSEGYSFLQQNIVVDLHFDLRRVQVWGDSYREVTGWTGWRK